MSSPRLEPVTPDNVLDACGLSVAPHQRTFVAPVAQSLAEAYVQPDNAWPRLVYDGDRLVGFLMAFFDVDFKLRGEGDVRDGLWRLNIAEGEQGKGYGRFAVQAVCDELRRRGKTRVTVTYHPAENGGPENFYRGLGFRPTGEPAGEHEHVAELDLV
ncbi:GNAT family N-acetyltransferase [Streptomyces sp. NPDC001941]|uniref:GNAT family N-acetyltransferase n=1 Tax=Streptomyces sp. NPDC001941 TaxID=3154659 RepID=UPI00331D4C5C